MTTTAPKSKRGAYRQINAILNKYRRDFAGGGAFGFDKPTFRLNDPTAYAKYVLLNSMLPNLPD